MTGRPERVGAFRGGRARRIHRPCATLDASPVGLPCRWRPRGSIVAPTVREPTSRAAAIQAAGSGPTDAVDPRDRSDLPPNP